MPRVYSAVVTERLLGMEFIEGVKLTEMGREGFGQDEVAAVVRTLVEYYGMTMHGPIFNTDPHPGNLLVEKCSGALVVLDWGQAKRLTAAERVAHGRLFLAISMEDINLLDDACTGLGAPFADLSAAPNATPATMIGALRLLL